jgi:hypothetical protein
MRKPTIAVLAFAALLGSLPGVAAQTYPSRPITMIVPLAAGGSTDIIGRLMAEGMRATLGQPIVVENVTGAGGTLGVGRLARSTPDGYTIGIGQWGTNVANGAIYPLQYDLLADFEPVSLIRCCRYVPSRRFRRQPRQARASSSATANALDMFTSGHPQRPTASERRSIGFSQAISWPSARPALA